MCVCVCVCVCEREREREREFVNLYLVCVRVNLYLGLMSRVFANGPGDRDSIPGRVIPKTQKVVLDTALLNNRYYKVRVKGKVEQSMERCRAFPYTLV